MVNWKPVKVDGLGVRQSKIKEYTKGPRLPLNFTGSYICKNRNCRNIGDFGINQREFSYKNENVVCSICGVDASYIRYDARLYSKEM